MSATQAIIEILTDTLHYHELATAYEKMTMFQQCDLEADIDEVVNDEIQGISNDFESEIIEITNEAESNFDYGKQESKNSIINALKTDGLNDEDLEHFIELIKKA